MRPVDTYSGPTHTGTGAARSRFARSRLEHALRASAAQHLRVIAVQHMDGGVEGRRAAAREQAISARLERLVDECRRDLETGCAAPPAAIDELAARRRDRVGGDRRITARGA